MLSKELKEYIANHTSPENEVLSELDRQTHLKTMYPRMLSGHVQGKFLEMVSHMVNPMNILEIGTFTGYSAICLSAGLKPGGKIHTIEINLEMAAIADEYFVKSGKKDKIIQYTGNALEIIPEMPQVFDLVFIDADKENYVNYYNLVIRKVRSGGYIMADNALWDGKVIGKGRADKETQGIIAFNKHVQSDPAVQNVLLSLRDGVMLIRKI